MTNRCSNNKLSILAAVLLCVSICAPGALADTISNCSSCNGASYSLTYNPTATPTGSNTEAYTFNFTIDYTGFNAAPVGSTVYIYAVGLKSSNDIVDPSTLVSAPVPTPLPAGKTVNDYWTNPLVTGSLSANACTDNTGNAFACAQALQNGSWNSFVVGQSGTFTFVMNINMGDGTLITSDSIKAEFVDVNGNKVGSLLSTTINASPAVPEPGSIALLTVGLIVLATRRSWYSRQL